MPLTIISNLKYTDDLSENVETDCPTIELPIIGKHYFKKKLDATTSDNTVPLDDIGTIGYVVFRSLAELVVVTTPDAPVVTPQGATAGSTWSYKVVAKQASGVHSAVSAAGTTTIGVASLNSTDFNRLEWPVVDGGDNAIVTYDVYRTAHATFPSTDGLIAADLTIPTLDDTGLTGDGTTAPSVADDNIVDYGEDGSSYPVSTHGSGFSGPLEWNGAAIHYKARTNDSKIEVTVIEK